MAVPDTIPVRYTEEEAEYLSVRPVRRQTFRLDELVDMVLSVTGKDAGRIQQILRSGTVVFHFYRYWWQALDLSAEELAGVLAGYPDPDPGRIFRAEECALILLESAGHPPRHTMELDRASADRRKLFSGQSAWDKLLAPARALPPGYHGYSYSRRADLFDLTLAPEQAAAILAEAARVAPRGLRITLEHFPPVVRLVYVSPRPR
jgi:hypothetical protein